MLSNESIERILDLILEEVMNSENNNPTKNRNFDWDTYWQMNHILRDRYGVTIASDYYGHHYVIDKP